MIKAWTAIKILLEQFGVKIDWLAVLKSRWAVALVVAGVMQFNGCKASRDAWYEGYKEGCQDCGNGRVEPLPDGDQSWYPFKHMRRWMFGTSAMQPPATQEDYEPTLAAPEVIEAPQ